MVAPNKPKTRRWLAAASVAGLLAVSGVAGLAISSHTAVAQITANSAMPSGFADLVDAVKPAVVSVNVDGEEQVQQYSGGPDFQFDFPDLPPNHPLRRFFQQFGEGGPNGGGNGQAQPQTRHFQAAGSGFIISADGYAVTNNHVVENADKVSVTFDNGDEHTATVVGTDPRTDLALLKIDGVSDLPFVQFADDEVRVGDWVVAVGNPFGLGGTVTAGIVSARGRDIATNSYGDFIQIDAAVNRGNSGGPAFNTEGKVVGVNTAIFSPNGGNVGIAFAIPASIVKQVIDDLKNNGSVTRGFLGVGIQNVSPDIADSLGMSSPTGALVTTPTPDSPADKAGIKSGDVIIAVDGEDIKDALALSRTVAQKAPGTKVDVTVWRNGQKQDFTVVLDTLNENADQAGSQMAPEKATPSANMLGLEVQPNPDGDGLLVADVANGSPAADKGFQPGDVILEANNQAMSTPQDFSNALAAVQKAGRKTILIKASRDGNVRFLGLPLASS